MVSVKDLGLSLTKIASIGIIALSCTESIPEAYHYQQQEEVFGSTTQVNTKIDLLWVVDNSASMDAVQQKLRNGFSSFAQKYMKPTWNIRIGVITTDTYLANPAFSDYLGRTLSNSQNTSAYIQGLGANFQNPDYNPTLTDGNGYFTNGFTPSDLFPSWNSDYAKLLSGNHDGPIRSICFEGLPHFYLGVSDCRVRDSQTNTGVANCLAPGSGESSISQCVNTLLNDTVRSGKPILSTIPDGGLSGSAWIDQLVKDFMVNATTGSAGHGSERGLGSVTQFLGDNETSDSRFFRADSLRGIIFVSDEDDQTMVLPTNPAASFNPNSNYACDLSGLQTLNPGGTTALNPTQIANIKCCTGGSCTYGDAGTSCPSKTVDGQTYTRSVCANTSDLVPVTTVKTAIDSFFRTLDDTGDLGDPNYFVVSIVPTTWDSISTLQAAREVNDLAANSMLSFAADRGDRYIDLATQVANGSLVVDISENDYAQVLDKIGQAILDKKGTFYLNRAPTNKAEMFLGILHANGSMDIVPDGDFIIDGSKIKIINIDLVLSLQDSDQIVVNYQPNAPGA